MSGQSNELPERSDALPGRTDALPKRSHALPAGWRQLRSNDFPDQSNGLPAGRDDLPGNANHLPDHAANRLRKRLYGLSRDTDAVRQSVHAVPRWHGDDLSGAGHDLPGSADGLSEDCDAVSG